MTSLNTTGRFTDKKVHLFKEVYGDRALTYCGLGALADIWRDPGEDVTCVHCLRNLTERVNEIGAKVDSIATGPDGALSG